VDRRQLDVGGRVEIRLAGAEADDVAPAAFSARALSVTAIVADGFTRASAADRKGIIISWQTS
jgi:hypothetical protein